MVCVGGGPAINHNYKDMDCIMQKENCREGNKRRLEVSKFAIEDFDGVSDRVGGGPANQT